MNKKLFALGLFAAALTVNTAFADSDTTTTNTNMSDQTQAAPAAPGTMDQNSMGTTTPSNSTDNAITTDNSASTDANAPSSSAPATGTDTTPAQ